MKFIKGIASFIGGVCASGVVSNLLKTNTNFIKRGDMIAGKIGIFILSGIAASMAEDYICEQIDDVDKTLNDIKAANTHVEIEQTVYVTPSADTDGDHVENPSTNEEA